MPLTPASSDYGSDFDDEDNNAHLIAILDVIEARYAKFPSSSYAFEDINRHDGPNVAKVPIGHSPQYPQLHTVVSELKASAEASYSKQPVSVGNASLEAEEQRQQQQYEHCLSHSSQIVQEGSPGKVTFEDVLLSDTIPDGRSPLERFRTAPKKPLSVTDLVSPAWCELQYWYVLTKHGRKKETPAMRQGSAVHKTLEDQVHQTVPVDVQTREDHWGLRIWNIIQGLRTLRATGLTRELEIWGIVDGQVVNGVIDELSLTCTDPELEAAIGVAERKAIAKEGKLVPENQQTIAEFFASRNSSVAPQGEERKRQPRRKNKDATTESKIYITDVKTRMSPRLPKAGSGLRPAITQLMLYRKLLGEIASNSVDSTVLFSRYRLDSSKQFSDSLLAQLGSIDFNSSPTSSDSSYSSENTLTELLSHNTLAALWGLMIEEYQKAMPAGADSISRVLRAEFRAQADGSVIGARTFPHKEADLQRYLDDEMSWWKGEREAKGVEIEEAYKCRICEFADNCTWRIKKGEEAATQGSKAREVAGAANT